MNTLSILRDDLLFSQLMEGIWNEFYLWGFVKEKRGWVFFFFLDHWKQRKEIKLAFWWDILFALSLPKKLGKIPFHSHIDRLLQKCLIAKCCLFLVASCLWQQHSGRAAIHQIYKQRRSQVTQALISKSEDGQLDMILCMRNKLFWTKSLICPVRDKHPEETGTFGKREEAQCNNAPSQACMCVTWLPDEGSKHQAFPAFFSPDKPHFNILIAIR